jgi:cytochrome c-type biogenesis protein CcmE
MTKKLDEELAEAIGETEESAGSGRTSTPGLTKPVKSNESRAPRSLGLLAMLLVMVGALMVLFFKGFTTAAIYSVPVDQILASRDKMLGKKVRVTGPLVPGTLLKRDSPCEYRFSIKGETDKLLVRYPQCVLPDTFRDVPEGGVEATVEGSLTAQGDFEATLVMAKCSSKYDKDKHEMLSDSNAKPAM